MQRSSDFWDAVDAIASMGKQRGVVYRTAEDAELDGRTIHLDGRPLVHFGSCSYLGLEVDPRLKEGAIEATRRYGTQFSSSRAFVSAPLYRDLDALLEQLFETPVFTAPTTTLAHMTALPVLLGEDDAVIVDQFVHHSVSMAIDHARLHGTVVELLRHKRLDLLAERIEELSRRHRRVWYALDGVFSMQGELAPVDALVEYLGRFEKLHLYVDDAHAMSWCGRHGRGWTLDRARPDARMVVVTSFAKGFGAAGAALIIADPELRRRVSTIGPPMLFSGPIQPPTLGAAVASARIHLTEEIAGRQAALRERIALFNRLATTAGLPLMAPDELVPIRFVAVGPPKGAYEVAARLQREGFFVNPAVFPAVPERRSGVRLTLTLHQRPEDIERLAGALAVLVPEVLHEQGYAVERTRKLFALGANPWRGLSAGAPEVTLQHARSIEELDRAEWDRLLGGRGSMSWEGLRSLEKVFAGNPEPENNWAFHYFIARDAGGRPALATFFTEALWKDDMLSPEAVSRRVEQRRADNRYYLTSRGLSMGSLATEGNHLWLDKQGPWRAALLRLLEEVGEVQQRGRAANLLLRDLPMDLELDAFLLEQGFVRFPMTDSMVLELGAGGEAEWLAGLSYNERRHQKANVLPFDEAFAVEVLGQGGRVPGAEELAHLHELYAHVWRRNLAINTFELPRSWLARILETPCWEVLTLTLRPEAGGDPARRPVAMAANVVGPGQYAFMIAGLDYRYVRSHGAYRQLLRHSLRRAWSLGARRLHLGLGTVGEKRAFGATASKSFVYVQATDPYNSALLLHMMGERPAGEDAEEEAGPG